MEYSPAHDRIRPHSGSNVEFGSILQLSLYLTASSIDASQPLRTSTYSQSPYAPLPVSMLRGLVLSSISLSTSPRPTTPLRNSASLYSSPVLSGRLCSSPGPNNNVELGVFSGSESPVSSSPQPSSQIVSPPVLLPPVSSSPVFSPSVFSPSVLPPPVSSSPVSFTLTPQTTTLSLECSPAQSRLYLCHLNPPRRYRRRLYRRRLYCPQRNPPRLYRCRLYPSDLNPPRLY